MTVVTVEKDFFSLSDKGAHYSFEDIGDSRSTGIESALRFRIVPRYQPSSAWMYIHTYSICCLEGRHQSRAHTDRLPAYLNRVPCTSESGKLVRPSGSLSYERETDCLPDSSAMHRQAHHPRVLQEVAFVLSTCCPGWLL